jgi:hypothetical protein
VLNGEELISGETPLDVVRELMKMEFAPPGSIPFMKRVAKRPRMMHPDRRIRTSRTQDFLDDMVAAGLLRRSRMAKGSDHLTERRFSSFAGDQIVE